MAYLAHRSTFHDCYVQGRKIQGDTQQLRTHIVRELCQEDEG